MDRTLLLAFNPYAFVSVPLFIAGLVFTCFLIRFKDKTEATRFLILMLVALTLGMAAVFATTALVYWGSAFWLAQDAFAITSMAALIQFAYYYPQRQRSVEAKLTGLFSLGIALLALGASFWHAFQVLVNDVVNQHVHPAYYFLMPFAFLVALGVCARRVVQVHRLESSDRSPSEGGRGEIWRESAAAFWRPTSRARVLRNLCLAVSLGLLQGIVSSLGAVGLVPLPIEAYAIGLALLALIVAIVYSTWDHVTRQPSLIVKLTGLSLVTLLAVLGAVGLFVVQGAVLHEERERALQVEIIRRAIRSNELTALPEAVVYVFAVAAEAPGESQGMRMVYARDADFDPRPLTEENHRQGTGASSSPTVWSYYTERYLRWSKPAESIRFYFGSHTPGSLYQYVSYVLEENGSVYEVGFSLADSERFVHEAGLRMVWVVVLSSLFILLAFPLFFRSSIVSPLARLMQGVAQANAGNLDVSVPVSYQDEIGYLTRSFNGMVVSIKSELTERRRLERALQEERSDLERRVEERTADLQRANEDLNRAIVEQRRAEEARRKARDELAVLHRISTAASQAKDLETLLERALSHSMEVLRGDLGGVFLLEETEDSSQPTRLRPVAFKGVSPEMPSLEGPLSAKGSLFGWMFKMGKPLLIHDISRDPRVPPPMRRLGARALLMAPLQADGKVLGALGLMRNPGRGFGPQEVVLLASIADQVGVAVQSDRLRKQAAVLEERQRLARDLHDSVTQSLYGLTSLTEAGQAQLEAGNQEIASQTLILIGETARQALKEMRLLVHQLRPPELDRDGLVAALHQRLAAVEGRSGVQARLLAEEDLRLPVPVENALYQIAQEALNNALRHAQARTVTVHLRREDGRVLLEVVDDGRGFDPAAIRLGGMGLANMRQRSAQVVGGLEVVSSPGEGTMVRVRLET